MHIAHYQQQKELIERALVNYESLKESTIKHVNEKDRYDLEYLSQSCMDVFFCKAFLGEDSDNKSLQDFMDALTAKVSCAVNVGKPIQYKFQGKVVDITPEARSYGVSTHVWNMGFFGAVLLNDEALLKTLTGIDIDALLAASGKKRNYTYSMSIALKAFYTKQKDYPELISAALKENMDVPKGNLLYDKALDIDGPAMELLYLLLLERNDQFNDRLLKALEWHKKYHMRLEKKDMLDNTGLISLPICAMVKLAKKLKNFNIAHSSDYVPSYLIEG